MATNIAFYLDEMMPRALAEQLEQDDIHCVMATDVGMRGKDDDTEHLVYATENSLVLMTRDLPYAGRVMQQTNHAGLVCWTGGISDIGGMVRGLRDIVDRLSGDDLHGRVIWIK